MKRGLGRPPIPSRIVVRGTNWVGDTVMSVPALRELRRIFPSSEICIWAAPGLEPLLRATEVPDEVIIFDRDRGGVLRRPVVMSRRLAGLKFDMAVLFQNAFESALTAWLAGIPVRLGYPTDLRGPLLNVKVPLTHEIRLKHQVFYYLAITDFVAKRFGLDGHSASDAPDCSVSLGESSLQRARELLLSEGADVTRPVLCLCPGSVNSEAKRWPKDYFSRLADLLMERLKASVVFLGAPAERDLVTDIISGMSLAGAVNLAGKADMMVSMAVMRLGEMVISNDTGSAHLAVAASSRVLTVFGPTVPGATAPYGPQAAIIQGTATCAPCRHYRCPLPDHPCMRSITPEAVLEKAEELLAANRLQAGHRRASL
ncbi:MAG: lipopolysaccharide heptosyltransferase II [Desulfomonile tiedjei]|nr:lipopolysaccharide heptosyltransferase II [Desulfomonile tiedjei]